MGLFRYQLLIKKGRHENGGRADKNDGQKPACKKENLKN